MVEKEGMRVQGLRLKYKLITISNYIISTKTTILVFSTIYYLHICYYIHYKNLENTICHVRYNRALFLRHPG